MPYRGLSDSDEDEAPPPKYLSLDELWAIYGVDADLKRKRSVDREVPEERPTVRRRFVNLPEPDDEPDRRAAAAEEPAVEPAVEPDRRAAAAEEPAVEPAVEPVRRFELYILFEGIYYDVPLGDEYYDEGTTYLNLIEEVQRQLRIKIPDYADRPPEVQLELRRPGKLKKTIQSRSSMAGNDVQTGDKLYATPLTNTDTIAKALSDPTTARLFHRAINAVQNQNQRHQNRGGKTRKRLRKRKRNCSKKRKRNCSKKRKRTNKRKRSTRKRR